MRIVTKTRITLPAALLAAAAISLPGCSGGGGGGPAVSDLSSVVVADPPPGFEEVGDVFGAFDLDGYLSNNSLHEDEDRAILTKAGFTRGYSRGFVNGAGDTVLAVFVFEAKDGDKASRLQKD